MKKKYYDLTNLLNTGCNWLLLYGMRSNGKSYAVKKHVIEDALDGKTFVYLRRWSEDIRRVADVESYFKDMPIREITRGQYDGIRAYQGNLYFYIINDDKPVITGNPIGRYCALNMYERYKSQVFEDIENIVFEEFLTDKYYLGNGNDEAKFLMQFVSTVARDRNIKIFMIGNTVSRVCPYFAEWGLKRVMQQKPGTIDIYHLHGENGIVDIAVENCEVVATQSKMFFGLASKQIVSGEWDVDNVPKLLKPYEYYTLIYEVTLKADDFKFIMQLMLDDFNGGLFVYIYPNTTNRLTARIITPIFDTNPFITNGFRPDIRAEVHMRNCLSSGKVCFSDNLTGTDFKQVIHKYDFMRV